MSKTRASAGGQVGVNGEFYNGGTFLPSTQRPKGIVHSRKATRRVLVEPGKLEDAPEGLRAIFQRIQHFVRFEAGQAVAQFPDDHASMTYYFSGANELHSLIAAYNNGERFH